MSSIPDGGSLPRPASLAPAREDDLGRFLLARKWAYVISTTAYLPLTHAEVEQHTLHLVNRLFEAIRSEPFDPAPAAGVGTRLVEMQCVGPDSIRRSVEVLGKALLNQPELDRVDRLAERVIAVLGEMMTGYSETLRGIAQRRQEGVSQSLLTVAADARRTGLVSQAHFDEVFRSSSSGIALVGLDGRFQRVNDVVPAIFGRPAGELVRLTLPDVVDPADAELLRDAYQDFLAGKTGRMRRSGRVTRQDGSQACLSFSGSLVHDSDGQPLHGIVIIDEDNDVALLRRRLTHQALHDVVTGLPNRRSFRAELDQALRRADPATGITLYHLDLDGFSLILGGHGCQLGDQLLAHVARVLKDVVAQEKATVARLGDDDFGIVVENTEATPAVHALMERLTGALSEPVYLDGDNGLATSAGVGVVHRPSSDTAVDELLRAAETTLRRAKTEGRGQWLLFDPVLDARDRETAALAASMPGALETGEIQVAYRPVVRLDGGRRVALEAVLSWEHSRHGRLPHDQCLDLAEPTGLILDLGGWLLSSACTRLKNERDGLWLSVVLTDSQSADPDLVGLVRRILDETQLSPERLVLGFPSRALADGDEAVDNLTVLSDIGVRAIVNGFGAVGDVLLLEDLPINGIRIDRRLVIRQSERPGHESATARMLRMTIDLAHKAGMRVSVDGVESEEQAGFWRAAGVDYALGDLFGRHTAS